MNRVPLEWRNKDGTCQRWQVCLPRWNSTGDVRLSAVSRQPLACQCYTGHQSRRSPIPHSTTHSSTNDTFAKSPPNICDCSRVFVCHQNTIYRSYHPKSRAIIELKQTRARSVIQFTAPNVKLKKLLCIFFREKSIINNRVTY